MYITEHLYLKKALYIFYFIWIISTLIVHYFLLPQLWQFFSAFDINIFQGPLGLHFEAYDPFIRPPIIKDEIVNPTPKNIGHISVYLPSFDKDCLEKAFKSVAGVEFHWFLDTVKEVHKRGNITYFPVNQKEFNKSLITCEGIITGGGFETPSEALFLGKKLLSIPIKEHYEQECNAAALKQLGVPVVYEVKEDFNQVIEHWLNSTTVYPKMEANNIPETLDYLFDTYSK